jgi:hypothetical protein
MRGILSSRCISPPQLDDERAEDPNPPREIDPDGADERLDDDERVDVALREDEKDDDDAPRPHPHPLATRAGAGP